MTNGVVKWFNASKGYGFIQPISGETDVLVHHSALEAAGICGLRDGQDVMFDIKTNGNGYQYVANVILA